MSRKLNMQDIVDLLVANNEISTDEADKFVVELFSLIEKGLSNDELAKVKDFGTFKLTHIHERESIDVNTQEKIVIPAHRRVSFVPAQLLKSLVNKPFAHFETTPLNDGIFMEGISQDIISDKDDDEDRIDEQEYETLITEPTQIESTDKVETIGVVIVDGVSTEDDKKMEDEDLLESPLASAPAHGYNADMPTPVETMLDDEEKNTLKGNSIVEVSKKRKSKKPKTRGKLRRYILRWDVAIALFVIFSVGFAYNYYFTKHKPCEQGVAESEIPKPIKEVLPAAIEPVVVVDSVEIVEALPRKKAKMSPGRTLRLIALAKLGNKEFWVYIYMINKDKIKNPNVVPIGLELELPHKNEYPMDANNPDDVSKAKKLGDEVIKSFR